MVGLPSDVGVSGGVDLADFGCGDVAALLRPLDGQLQVGGVAADGVAPGVERAADGGGVDLPEPQAARRVDADQVVVVQAGGQPRQTGPRRAAVPLRFHHSAPSALTSKTRSFFFFILGAILERTSAGGWRHLGTGMWRSRQRCRSATWRNPEASAGPSSPPSSAGVGAVATPLTTCVRARELGRGNEKADRKR